MDRFLFKHVLSYPSRDEEREIVARHGHSTSMPKPAELGIIPVAGLADLVAIRQTVGAIQLTDVLVDYIVDIIRATREHPSIEVGASPRAAATLATAGRAYAAIRGRDFVIPDDIKALSLPALRHRLVLSPAAEIEGLDTTQVVTQIVDQIPAPR